MASCGPLLSKKIFLEVNYRFPNNLRRRKKKILSDLCAVAHTLLSLHDNTPQKKRSGSHDPTECPHGLGGFSAWPAQAWAFPDRQAPQEGAITNQLLPTECPHGSRDLFRLGSPSQGIFLFTPVNRAGRGNADQQSLEPEGCPNGLGGFSAFNLPRPGFPSRVEGSESRV